MAKWLVVLFQTLLFIGAAPLFIGWVKWLKCRLQNRRGPDLLQSYRDLAKLFRKELMLAESASVIFRIAPYIVFSVVVIISATIPLISLFIPTTQIADVIVLVGLFALGRFFLALAAMDVGTAFGGMGASREMTVSSLAEPALLMVVFTLAMTASSTNLSSIMSYLVSDGITFQPSFIFIFLSILLVAVAETGRIPVDNPDTHLELTMIHEAMILEYSGRHLALMEWAGHIKFMLYGVLIADLFFPWGIATRLTPMALAIAVLVIVFKLAIFGISLAISETVLAKVRLFRVPQILSLAFIFSLVGLLSHIMLEAG